MTYETEDDVHEIPEQHSSRILFLQSPRSDPFPVASKGLVPFSPLWSIE
jgi:hypothetical protein